MIRVAELGFAYGPCPVLKQISLSVAPGEVLGVVGANGSGKSTLLRCIAGAAPDWRGWVSSGELRLGEATPESWARQVGYLPQRPQAEWPMPVREVVALGRLPHQAWWQGVDSAVHSSEVQHALEACDVAGLATRRVDALSGGEFARVMLARLMAGRHKVLIADEPIADLDPPHRVDVMSLLRDEADSGKAIVVALHDLLLADRFCDRVIVMRHGQVIAQGTPETIFDAGTLTCAFGAPCEVARVDGRLTISFDGTHSG